MSEVDEASVVGTEECEPNPPPMDVEDDVSVSSVVFVFRYSLSELAL